MADDTLTIEQARDVALLSLDRLANAWANTPSQAAAWTQSVNAIDALIAAVAENAPTQPPGSFGYCAVCYHPLDQCTHCAAVRAEHTQVKKARRART